MKAQKENCVAKIHSVPEHGSVRCDSRFFNNRRFKPLTLTCISVPRTTRPAASGSWNDATPCWISCHCAGVAFPAWREEPGSCDKKSHRYP